ncbi:MAG: hypothetical protein AB1847_03755 [bacterium]
MFAQKKLAYVFFILVSLVALSLVYSPISQAQNWAALPPYNTLWPLWAPALSPVDAVSGLPVPIVSELTHSTVLPVQPGLTWDPAAENPWLLYNTPLGMAYFDPIGGVNMWPPSYLLDTAGSPLPLTLPLDYGYLPPTASSWLTTNVPLGNISALAFLMTIPAPGPIFTPPAWGPIVPPTFGGLFLAPSAFFPVAPPAVAPLPVPTAIAPLPVPTAIAPLPVPTVITALPAPTALTPLPVPTAIAPLPVPTIVAPSALVPTAIVAPTVLAPTAVVPLATTALIL